MIFRRKPDKPDDHQRLRVLMVCMGNICRSPTAEGVLRHMLEAQGLQDRVEVDSAGTHGWHAGAPPDDRAIAHARRRGYDLSALRARAFLPLDFQRFDLILAMDERNLDHVLRQRPQVPVRGEAGLLLAYGRDARRPREVPDPYYGGPADFDRVLDLVEDACDGLLDALLPRLRSGAPEQGTS